MMNKTQPTENRRHLVPRTLALVLALLMCVNALPIRIFAADADTTQHVTIDLWESAEYDFAAELSEEAAAARGVWHSTDTDTLSIDDAGHATAHKVGDGIEVTYTYLVWIPDETTSDSADEGSEETETPAGTWSQLTVAWDVTVVDNTPEVPLVDVLRDEVLYVTIYDAYRTGVIDTNDPNVKERIANGELVSYIENDMTVDLKQNVFVFFRMPSIIHSEDDTGIQEGYRYYIDLPDELVPDEFDQSGNKIINPDEPIEFFSIAGRLNAVGGIYGEEGSYRLVIIFTQVDDERSIAGAFQYSAIINPSLEEGSAQNPDFGPGGKLHFTVTPADPPEEEPEPEKYTFDMTMTPSKSNDYNNFDYDWTITIRDNTENAALMPYQTVYFTLGDGMYIPVYNGDYFNSDQTLDWSEVTGPLTPVRVIVTYSDGTVDTLTARGRNGQYSYYIADADDRKYKFQMEFTDIVNEEALYNGSSSYFYSFAKGFHITLGAYMQGWDSYPGASGYAIDIREIKIVLPSIVYEDWKLYNTGKYYSATAVLGNSMDSDLYPTKTVTAGKSISYGMSVPSMTNSVSGYSMSKGYEYRPEKVYTTLKTNNSYYGGNYYWVDVDPAYYNDILTNYYMSNRGFQCGSLVGSGSSGTFNSLLLKDSDGRTLVSGWQFQATFNVGNAKSGYVNFSCESCYDPKLRYEVKKVFADACSYYNSSFDVVVYRSTNRLPNGDYAYIMIDPRYDCYNYSSSGHTNNGWYEYIEACYNTDRSSPYNTSARPAHWRIHIFNAPNTSLEMQYEKKLGMVIASDINMGGHVEEKITAGVGGYDNPDYSGGYSIGSYSLSYYQAAYMKGTWVNENTIFWEFTVDATNWPSWYTTYFWVSPQGSQYVQTNNSAVTINGQTLYTQGAYVKQTNGTWYRFNTSNYNNSCSFTPGMTVSNMSMYPTMSGISYCWTYGSLTDYRDPNTGDITIGFFTGVYGSQTTYTCQAELVVCSGDVAYQSSSGGSQYPFKVSATGSVAVPYLSKSGKLVTGNDVDPNSAETEWTINISNVTAHATHTSSFYDSETRRYTSLVDGYYGWFSGVLDIMDDMRNSYAVDQDGNTVGYTNYYTHITKMFSNGFGCGGPNCSLGGGPIPYADSSSDVGYYGDTHWQKYVDGEWRYMGADCLWDPYSPGIYRYIGTYTYDGFTPSVYVYYAGNMTESISSALSKELSEIDKPYAYASHNYYKPLQVEFRDIRDTSNLPTITYVTEFDNKAFFKSISENDPEKLVGLYTIRQTNSALLTSEVYTGGNTAYTTVTATVAAGLAIAKKVQAGSTTKPNGDYSERRESKYTVTVTNGFSDSPYIYVEDFLTMYGNTTADVTGNNAKNYLSPSRSWTFDIFGQSDGWKADEDALSAAEALMRNLLVNNMKITMVIPDSDDEVVIYENGAFTEGWNSSAIDFASEYILRSSNGGGDSSGGGSGSSAPKVYAKWQYAIGRWYQYDDSGTYIPIGVNVETWPVWQTMGIRPDSLTVTLCQDGEPYGEPVVLSDENGWYYEWEMVPYGYEWTVETVSAHYPEEEEEPDVPDEPELPEYITTHPGSLYQLNLVMDDGQIPADATITITYDLELIMDADDGGFRNSGYYDGHGLWVETAAQATRPYKNVDEVEPEEPEEPEDPDTEEEASAFGVVSPITIEVGTKQNGWVDEENGTITVECGTAIGSDFLYFEQVNKTSIKTSSSKNSLGLTDHWEWKIVDWTGSMGKTTEESLTLTDRIYFTFEHMLVWDEESESFIDVVTDDSLDLEVRQAYLTKMAELINKYTTYSNFKVYRSDTKAYLPNPLWVPTDLVFSGADSGTKYWWGSEPVLRSMYFQYSPSVGPVRHLYDDEDTLLTEYVHTAFTLSALNLNRNEYLICTYDTDIDWDAIAKEAMEMFGVFSLGTSINNGVSSSGGKSDSSSGGSIEVRDATFGKNMTSSNSSVGTATWELKATTGGNTADELVINDTVGVTIPDGADERVKKAAEAATSIGNVKITKDGKTIYDNGEYADGWSAENLTVEIDGLTLRIVIKNTEDNTVLDVSQTYVVTYQTTLDKDLFIQNGGMKDDVYTLENAANMRYGNFSDSASAESDFKPDTPIEAEKTTDGVDSYTASWTATAKTGVAQREAFTLTDVVTALPAEGLDWISISSMTITVVTGDGEPVVYTPDDLPEGVTLTTADGGEFVLNENGVNSFKLVFDKLPADTTVTANYVTALDWEGYKVDAGVVAMTFTFTNAFSASCADGNTADGGSARVEIEASDTFEKLGMTKGKNAQGHPLLEWTFELNLRNSYSNEELSKFESIRIVDELSSVLKYVEGSLIAKDSSGKDITSDIVVETNGNAIIFNVKNPLSHPVFTITFTTECLASVDSLENSASLVIEGQIVDESTSDDMGRQESSGVFGVIRSTSTATFVPTAYKYVDHELCTEEGAYVFQLIEVDENWNVSPGAYMDTASNDADGLVQFQQIIYDTVGTYYYLMKEFSGKDDRTFKLKVDVVETDEGFVVTSKIVEPVNYQDIRFDNTDDDKLTDFTVTKVWVDNDNAACVRPERITVYLYQNGEPYNNMSVELSEANGWTYTWTDLPIAGGAYSAVEGEIEGYEGTAVTENGVTTITNTVTVGSLTISKTVVGSDGETDKDFYFTITLTDAEGNELEDVFSYISNKLDENGEPVTGTVTSGDTVSLKHGEYITILYLPEGVQYKVVETSVTEDGYTTISVNNNGVITVGENAEAEFFNKKGTDDDHGDCKLTISKTVTGVEGDALTDFHFVIILKDAYGFELTEKYDYIISRSNETFERGTLKSGATIELKHGESITITGLPVGTQYEVTEVEADQDGYTTTATGAAGTITDSAEAVFVNSKGEPGEPKPAYVEVSVKKVWEGDNSNVRPGEITVQLYRNGEAYGEPVTLNALNKWSHVWKYLDRDSTWTVKEVNVPDGYRMTVSNDGNDWTITNIKITDITVKKVWKGDNENVRPDEITVQLYQDGKAYGEPVKLNAANGWSYTWTGLDEGHEWTVEEVNVPDGYRMTVSNDGNDWTITNTKITDVTVKKVWKGDNENVRPDEITVQLYQDGKAYGEPVKLNAANGWSYTWIGLDEAHEWTVEEVNVPDGYRMTVSNDGNDWTITTPKITGVTVKKVWKGDNENDRPEEITVQLYQDGKAYGEPVKLNAANGWSYTWIGLDEAHEWTVEEVNVPDGYRMTVSNDGNDWTITNTKDETDIPKTGDEDHSNLWGAQMILSLLGIIAIVFFPEKKKRLLGSNGR